MWGLRRGSAVAAEGWLVSSWNSCVDCLLYEVMRTKCLMSGHLRQLPGWARRGANFLLFWFTGSSREAFSVSPCFLSSNVRLPPPLLTDTLSFYVFIYLFTYLFMSSPKAHFPRVCVCVCVYEWNQWINSFIVQRPNLTPFSYSSCFGSMLSFRIVGNCLQFWSNWFVPVPESGDVIVLFRFSRNMRGCHSNNSKVPFKFVGGILILNVFLLREAKIVRSLNFEFKKL